MRWMKVDQTGQDGFAKVRTAVVVAVVEGTAREKHQLGLRTKARMSGQVLDVKVGELIDFYRGPPNKDVSGWRGPATVTDASMISEGQVGFRWQGRGMTATLDTSGEL